MEKPISLRAESAAHTRRALLGGAFGGLLAWFLGLAGRPTTARAEGEAIAVGGDYITATSTTLLEDRTNANDVLVVNSNGIAREILDPVMESRLRVSASVTPV